MKLFQTSLFIIIFAAASLAASQSPVPAPSATPTPEKKVSEEFARCWTFGDDTVNFLRIEADQTSFLAAGDGGRVIALDKNTGKEIWKTDLGGEPVSDLVIAKDRIFVVTRSIGKDGVDGASVLRSLSRETGIPGASVEIEGKGNIWIGGIGEMIVAAADSGEIVGFLAGDLGLKWKFSIASGLSSSPVVDDNIVYLPSKDNKIVGIAPPIGEAKFTITTRSPATAISANGAGMIVYGDDRGEIFESEILTGKTIWKFRVGARVSRIERRGNRLLVTSFDNFLYFISSDSGHVVWKKRMSGRIIQVIKINDERLAIFAIDSSNATVADSDDGHTVSQFALTSGAVAARGGVLVEDPIVVLSGTEISAFSLTACKK